MKRSTAKERLWSAALGLVLLTASAAHAVENAPASNPWEKFSLKAGYFMSAVDTTVRLGTGLGVDIDVEDALGLESSNSAFRLGTSWRFSQNRRHRLDLSWFSLNRKAGKNILEDITFENDDGEVVTLPVGTRVNAEFDLDIYLANYSYSLLQDDRVDLAAEIGLYIMPIRVGISAGGLVDESAHADFTAPLPEVGLRMDVLLKSGWFLRSGVKVFYVEYENFKGSLLSVNTAVEYQPWKHLGIGLGYDSLVIALQAEDKDWPEIDLKGKIRFSYAGLQIYLRYFF